jgi:hypothetical protein
MVHPLNTESLGRGPWHGRIAACLLALVLAACGGGDPPAEPPATMQVTITGADGASMDFTPAEGLPAAALNITRADAGAPALPPDMRAAGAVYQFAPHGHVGSAIEIRVPFDGAPGSGGTPRLLVTLPGEASWSEVDAQLDGTMLRARVPALGYAVVARPLSAAGTGRQTASAMQAGQYFRGQISAEPALQGSGFLLMASEPSLATIRLDYSFGQSCAAPIQLRLRALVARSPSSTLPFALRTVDLGSRAVAARAGSESFELPLTAANNGSWVFLADARCIEQRRVRFGVLTVLPMLAVKIVNAPPPPPAEGSATIGAAGGFVTGPDGVRLGIPPAALESDITFRIARDSSGAPPLPGGIDLASAVYAITPHGQPFAVSASVELPVSAALAAGRQTFLMKAEPGGRWSVIGSSSGTAVTLRSGIDSLSYLAVGVCQDNLPAGSQFAQACPSSNQLGLELLLNGTTPVPISQDTTYGAPIPVVLVTTPETLTFRMTWTRPAGTNRVDTLDTGTGLSGSTVVRHAGFTFATAAPRFLQVNENSFSRTFTVDVDPTRVSGATGPNGVVRRIWAQAAFAVIGPGNVGSANWEFNAWVPIQVRSLEPLPVIDGQPANVGVTEGQPASFSVAASIAPAATLNYQWARRTGATFTPIPGATTPSYTIPAAQLADNGAQFQVELCATRCVTSNVATLTVTQAPVAPSFIVQPSDIGVAAGQTASFTTTATGNPLPRIDWQSAPASDPNNFTAVAGVPACMRTDPPSSGTSTAATCTVGPLVLGDSGRRYRAVATNSATTVNGNPVTVTVNPVPVAPSITQQPQPQTTTVGGNATFTVTATGTATLGYIWKLNGTALPSVSAGFASTNTCRGDVTYSNGNATITLSNVTAGCNGLLVTVEVDNTILPKALSNGATLTVNAVTQTLSLLAGAIGGSGSVDGAGDLARVGLNPENGLAVDGAGNAYFSEAISGRVRKVTPAGVVTTIAGASTALRGPAGVAVDSAGNVFVAERNAGRILRISPAGDLVVWAQFLSVPTHLAIDAANNLYVTSETGSRDGLISKVSPNQSISTFHLLGSGEYMGAIAVASNGSVVYGVGGGTLDGTVVSITSGGTLNILAGSAGEVGNVDGPAAAARFGGINGLAIGTAGALFATDGNNQSIRRIEPGTGAVVTVSGAWSFPVVPRDGEGTAVGRYEFPGGIGAGPGGDLLVGDVATLRKLQTTPTYVVSTLAGKWLQTGGNGSIGFALDVALDGNGNAYVAGLDRIYKVTPAGAVTTHATIPARYLAFDRTNNVLVAASTSRIWRVTTAVTPVIADLAGMNPGYVDATGANASFVQIGGLAADAAGNVFVAERLSHTIRRVTPQGVVITYAGAQDQAGVSDGAATAARFNSPSGLAVDGSGNLLVADSGSLTIRRITIAGFVSTLAGGTAPGSVDGTGLAARFRSLGRLALDGNGNLLIGDGSTLRRMNAANVVTTVMGVDAENSVRLGASPRLNAINGLAVRPDGKLVLTSEAAVLEATIP